jgi:hypothetical protein
MALYEVDRSAKVDAAVKADGIGHRPGVSLVALETVCEAERKFEMSWYETGIVLTRSAQPLPEIGADRSDTIFPDAVDSRSKIILVPRGDLGHNRFKQLPRPVEITRLHGKQVLVPQTREQLELDIVDEGAALQRVELIEHSRHLTRPEAMYSLKEEAVRAAGKILKRSWRIAPGAKSVLLHDRPNSRLHSG